ncbi:MAG TPA: copper homeostasis protein CutC [Algoriphagus sp.]|jgi:copper homeostasis protein|uniref:copper homeostasis protein CutC n=1 Tax=unclassified Algoriphagus TaxID=2641541 RepID=UPI000C3DC919|nr:MULTISPECIES: copper homeostasis protein CutC [unclassified Algoriphagus]MAL12627.1 copper homeostasis protein CutC [Algoriphagus sp.]MAN88417.1 copper homeostasis protein CutC [Algoriphagus sp.]HAH37731.1 copper homeostasis protein CutC [Algoriphagus sp.]HCD89259.1 copper homeostasis protein CutC [Algoriphagus sp.]HCX75058.1 copper homeostasis protein CutC [Algoriphagus sp.]
MNQYILEAPVFNLRSALDAADFGVHRLELCGSFLEGGETPSAGMLKVLKETVQIPIFVMIRPRGGDFCYSKGELEVMKRDIQILGEMGADGFVFGALKPNGEVDKAACNTLLKSAAGKPCTFHRAIDVSKNPLESLEDIVDCGFARILTSGAKNSVSEGINTIKRMLEKAGNRIIIMPGGGSEPAHVKELQSFENFKEIHASCKVKVRSENRFTYSEVKFSPDENSFFEHLGIDAAKVQNFLKAFAS